MPRTLDPIFAAGLTAGNLLPCLLLMLSFRSATVYLWTGTGPLRRGATTYLGIGVLNSVAEISEALEVSAEVVNVGLSGLDPSLLAESLADIRVGAPAAIGVGLLDPAQLGRGPVLLGTPATLFQGMMGPPAVSVGAESIDISLGLEAGSVYLQRATNRRWSYADQAAEYPTDTSMFWVEALNDQALLWG